MRPRIYLNGLHFASEANHVMRNGVRSGKKQEKSVQFPMAGYAYGVNVTSIKFGETELLNFVGEDKGDAYIGGQSALKVKIRFELNR